MFYSQLQNNEQHNISWCRVWTLSLPPMNLPVKLKNILFVCQHRYVKTLLSFPSLMQKPQKEQLNNAGVEKSCEWSREQWQQKIAFMNNSVLGFWAETAGRFESRRSVTLPLRIMMVPQTWKESQGIEKRKVARVVDDSITKNEESKSWTQDLTSTKNLADSNFQLSRLCWHIWITLVLRLQSPVGKKTVKKGRKLHQFIKITTQNHFAECMKDETRHWEKTTAWAKGSRTKNVDTGSLVNIIWRFSIWNATAAVPSTTTTSVLCQTVQLQRRRDLQQRRLHVTSNLFSQLGHLSTNEIRTLSHERNRLRGGIGGCWSLD